MFLPFTSRENSFNVFTYSWRNVDWNIIKRGFYEEVNVNIIEESSI
jgi:hypothetical protein